MAKKKSKKNKSTSTAPSMTYEERQAAEAAKAKRKKRGIIAAVIAGIAAVVVFVLIGSASTGIYAAHTNAATVGGVRVSTPLYDYYYENTYYALANGYGTTDLESALGENWKDLIISYADYTLQQDIALYTEAANAGVTLSEEGQATVDAAVEEMRNTAAQNGQDDVDKYLAGSVGAGCNLENYRQYMEIQTLADEYSTAHRESLSFTQDEVDARLAEDPSRYDMYSFYSQYLEGATEEEAAAITAQITDLDSFNSAISAYQDAHSDGSQDEEAEGDPSDYCYRNNIRTAYINTGILEWIEGGVRSEGDVTYVNYNDNGYFIVYYVSKNEDRAVIDNEITEDLRSDAMTEWLNGILEQYPVEHSWIGMQGVGAYDR